MKRKFLSLYLIAICVAFVILNFSCKEEHKTEQVHIYGSLVDIDGNEYKTVTIGDYEWMAENLRVTRYNDGSQITTNVQDTDWGQKGEDNESAYAIFPNNMISGFNSDEEVLETYGLLYNWHTVTTGRLCPVGWRVPTDEEWTLLTNLVGGSDIAGSKLKSTTGWYNNGDGTNDYGFSAYPGGYRYHNDGRYYGVGYIGYWWSITEGDTSHAWSPGIHYGHDDVVLYNYSGKNGFSVRCLRPY